MPPISIGGGCHMHEEMIEIVDTEGSTIGIGRRSEVHGNPSLLHKVVHVLVFNDVGNLLLQKRSMNKDVAPGKWDTSVGGHVSPGEDLKTAALREMKEELGIILEDIEPLYSYIHSDSQERELVFSYRCKHNGPFPFDRYEIDKVAFWSIDEIRKSIGSGLFSGHFESEMTNYFSFKRELI
jgi:isopentenyldiphosphate isomerase